MWKLLGLRWRKPYISHAKARLGRVIWYRQRGLWGKTKHNTAWKVAATTVETSYWILDCESIEEAILYPMPLGRLETSHISWWRETVEVGRKSNKIYIYSLYYQSMNECTRNVVQSTTWLIAGRCYIMVTTTGWMQVFESDSGSILTPNSISHDMARPESSHLESVNVPLSLSTPSHVEFVQTSRWRVAPWQTSDHSWIEVNTVRQ